MKRCVRRRIIDWRPVYRSHRRAHTGRTRVVDVRDAHRGLVQPHHSGALYGTSARRAGRFPRRSDRRPLSGSLAVVSRNRRCPRYLAVFTHPQRTDPVAGLAGSSEHPSLPTSVGPIRRHQSRRFFHQFDSHPLARSVAATVLSGTGFPRFRYLHGLGARRLFASHSPRRAMAIHLFQSPLATENRLRLVRLSRPACTQAQKSQGESDRRRGRISDAIVLTGSSPYQTSGLITLLTAYPGTPVYTLLPMPELPFATQYCPQQAIDGIRFLRNRHCEAYIAQWWKITPEGVSSLAPGIP